ncbi:MAG: response regulator [Planctomycetota bacterium]|jgi:chromosome segregation ATPase
MFLKKLSQKCARILAIHRDRAFRTLLGNVANRLEHHLQIAESAREGLNFLKNEPADIVFYDVKLPRIEGKEALEKLSEIVPGATFIAVADYADVDKAVRAAYLGAQDYVLKPFDGGSLGYTIERALVEKERAKLEKVLVSVADEIDSSDEEDVRTFLNTIIEERETLLDALGELMPMKDKLEQIASERDELAEELKQACNVVNQFSDVSAEQASGAKKIAALEEQLRIRTEELESLSVERNRLLQDFKIAQEGVGPVTRELSKVREKLSSALDGRKKLESAVNEANSLSETAKGELRELKVKQTELDTEVARREGRIAALSAKCERLEEELKELGESKKSLVEQLAVASGEKGEVVGMMGEKQARIADLENGVKAAQNRIKELEEASERRSGELGDVRNAREKLSAENASLSTANAEFDKRVTVLEKELAHITHERDEKRRQFDVLTGSKAEVAVELERKERKIVELSELVNELEANVSETSGMAKSIESMLDSAILERDEARKQLSERERHWAVIEGDFGRLKTEFERVDSARNGLSESLNALTGEKAEVKAEIEKRDLQITNLREQLSDVKDDLIELGQGYEEVVAERDRARAERAELAATAEKLETDKVVLAGFKQDKERLEKEKSALDMRLGGVLVELEEFKSRATESWTKLTELEKNFHVVSNEREDFETEAAQLRKELDAVRSTGESASESLITELESVRSELKTAVSERREYAENIVEFEREKEFLEREVVGLTERVKNLSIVEEKFLSELDNAKALQKTVTELREKLQEAGSSIDVLTTETNTQRSENERVLIRFENAVTHGKDLEREIGDFKRDLEEVRGKFAETSLKLETAEGSNEELIKKVQSLQRLNETISAEKSELASTVSVMNELNARIEELEGERNKLAVMVNTEKTNALRQVTERDRALAELGETLDERDRTIHEMEQTVAELRSVEVDRNRIREELSNVNSELRSLKSDFEALRGAKEFIESRLAETEAVRNRIRTELSESDSRYRTAEQELETTSESLEFLEAEKADLTGKVTKLTESVEESTAEIEGLREKLSEYESTEAERIAAKEKEIEIVRMQLEGEVVLLQEELAAAHAKVAADYETEFVHDESYRPGVQKISAAQDVLGVPPDEDPGTPEGRLRALTIKSNALEFALDELRDENSDLKSEKRELGFKLREMEQTKARVAGLARELESVEEELAQTRKERRDFHKERAAFETQLNRMRIEVQNASAQVSSLQSQRESLKRALDSTKSAMQSIAVNLKSGSPLVEEKKFARTTIPSEDPAPHRISKVLQRLGI